MVRSRGSPGTAVGPPAAAEVGVAVEAADGATALSHNTKYRINIINLVRLSSLRLLKEFL